MGLAPELIAELSEMPDHLVRVIRQIPSEKMSWKPEVWAGSPGETFSALEHEHLSCLHWLLGKMA